MARRPMSGIRMGWKLSSVLTRMTKPIWAPPLERTCEAAKCPAWTHDDQNRRGQRREGSRILRHAWRPRLACLVGQGLAYRTRVFDNHAMHDPLGRLLELRLRVRRNPQARAYVDRALALVARTLADEPDMATLDGEVDRLTEDLAKRFGQQPRVSVQ